MKVAPLAALIALVLVGQVGCKKKRGVASIDEVSAAIQEALKLGESTWPGAKVGGVKVGDMVPDGARQNAYTVRVSFEFDADPTDATAKSGSVECSPRCVVLRHKMKRAPAPPFPCAFADALAAARKAGLSNSRPAIEYGYWNLDGRTGWTFRSKDAGPIVEIREGCAVWSAAKIARPAQPTDGTPVAVEFLGLDGSGDRLSAKLRLFNFTDKEIQNVRLHLNYLDAGGQKLKDFPWGQSKKPYLVEKKGVADISAGAFLPAETKTVTVELRQVDYTDGTKWEPGQ